MKTHKIRKKRILTEEHKRKIGDSVRGNKHTKETKLKISNSTKGKIFSYEVKRKISESKKGTIPWNKGKINIYSDETLKKMSESKSGENNYNYGKEHTKETKEKIRQSKLGENNPNYRKQYTDEEKKILSDSLKGRKFTKETRIKLKRKIDKIKNKYPLFAKIEEMRYNPDKPGEKEIQVHCKNHKCKNSKEQEGWFTPTGRQIEQRISEVEKGNGGSYFYCRDECKEKCPLYKLNPSYYINSLNVSDELIYTSEEYNIWRQEVLKRANNLCEYCGKEASDCHHSRPQKLEPFFSLDPDFGIACCEKCHYKKGHKDECSTGELSNLICK